MQRHVVVVERAGIGHLAARFGVDGSAVENDFGFVARLDFVHLALLGDDAFDARVARLRAEVKIGLGLESFGELQIDGARRFLVRALSRKLSRACAAPASRVEIRPSRHANPASRATSSMKSRGKTIGVVEFEGFLALDRALTLLIHVPLIVCDVAKLRVMPQASW